MRGFVESISELLIWKKHDVSKSDELTSRLPDLLSPFRLIPYTFFESANRHKQAGSSRHCIQGAKTTVRPAKAMKGLVTSKFSFFQDWTWKTAKTIRQALSGAACFAWHWSVPYRNSHRPNDLIYASVWRSNIDAEYIRQVLKDEYPDILLCHVPSDEESLRHFLQNNILSKPQNTPGTPDAGADGRFPGKVPKNNSQHNSPPLTSEEACQDVPVSIRHCLAASNATHLERKLELLLRESYHPSSGRHAISRSTQGIHKTFRMWRHGFRNATSLQEHISTKVFFAFLTFSAIYPDVAAGLLGERSYNQRSIASRVMTLIQLFFLWTFPFHSLWLLFNWSLERLLGALVGNAVYGLAAIVPSIHDAYNAPWFRDMMLALSISWQVGVQFLPTIRNYVVRLLIRRQMAALRSEPEADSPKSWAECDAAIQSELLSQHAFAQRQYEPGVAAPAWYEVPIKVRMERYIQFTSTFTHGRSSDQLIALLKDDMEGILNTFEDYNLTIPSCRTVNSIDKGHVEPRLPKLALVFFDIVIFTYLGYSFWTQPFTFNTVVAYGTVVVIKQTLLAMRRYQTIKAARRLFTNMVSVNILGMFLVSLPVTIDRDILEKDSNMVALTLAMILATLFLSEPIAPVLLTLSEKGINVVSRLKCTAS